MSTIVSGSRALLELQDITVSFDGFLALRDLNLSLEPGELLEILSFKNCDFIDVSSSSRY